MSNVVPLMPKTHRGRKEELGFFVRVGHNDHRVVLDLLANGERGLFGVVVAAQHANRHSELISDARDRGLDVILDPKTQEMATPGGFTSSLSGLPWADDDFHRLSAFTGGQGRERVESVVRYAVEGGFTQLIGPTHLLNGPNDAWLRTDVQSMGWAKDALNAADVKMPLIYSLALPIAVLRDRTMRQALMPAILDVPCDAIWLKIENFGDDSSGEKTAAYLEACRDFHAAGVPLVADYVGGLPGLATLAFGGVGGMAHGVGVYQNFKASGLRRPPVEGRSSFAPPAKRVYIPQLDTLLAPEVAKQLIQSSPRARGHFSCNDQHCCPKGMQDMLAHAGRHALYRRAREIEEIARIPQDVRAASFIDQMVRPVSDDIARAAGFPSLPEEVRKKFGKKQTQVSAFRSTLTHLSEVPVPSVAEAPKRRSAR